MTAKNAKCPYYKCETQKYNILCRSAAPPEIYLAYKFSSITEKLRHRTAFCTSYDYFNCPVFIAVTEHYKKQEDIS